MKVRYDKDLIDSHFPYIAYEYRDYRALLASDDEPSEEYELFGLYKSLNLHISYTRPE